MIVEKHVLDYDRGWDRFSAKIMRTHDVRNAR